MTDIGKTKTSCRGRRNADETMSKGRGGTNVNFGVQGRQRSTIILESSPSAEIASYDYEAVLIQSELEESHTDDKDIETNPLKDCSSEQRVTTLRDLEKECSPKTVCFSTDDQISGKWMSATELGAEIPSPKKITEQECASCKNIVNESGDEAEIIGDSTADVKELPENSVAPVQSNRKTRGEVSSIRKEKKLRNTSKIKTSLKDFSKRKIVNSSLLDGNKNSKIPRATTIACAVARVYQTARIPSRGSSKSSLCARSFFNTEHKPANFITESNQAPVTKICNILELAKGSAESVVDITLKKSKSSRINSQKEERTDTKKGSQPCDESPRTQVISAGDHPLAPSPTSAFRNLRLDNACRSCNNRRQETVNLQLSIHDVHDPWSDSKSSPEIGCPDRWSKTLKLSPYSDSTSEEVDMSSEYSSDSVRPTTRKCFTEKVSAGSPISDKSGNTRNTPHQRPRRRARVSFFNTLFDIVFWPFLFLRTNR